MKSNKILFDSQPLVIIPELAVKIGLNESIVVQQIHYWVCINSKAKKNLRDGFYWTYNTFEQWQAQFPFWSVRTIRRIITGLVNAGIIISENHNKSKFDHTAWYRLDYEALERISKKQANVIPINNDMATRQDDITEIIGQQELDYWNHLITKGIEQ